MDSRRVDDRTFIVVLATGEDVIESLSRFARDQGVATARLTGIGALEGATMGFYDRPRKDYERYSIDGAVELLSLTGNITTFEGEPRIHVHAVVSDRDGSARGGHLFDARVGPTLELFVVTLPTELQREMDDEVGLPLINP